MENRKKILIDTDIGDDIDDAVALLTAMALDFEIVGVTTVFRDTQARAAMVKKKPIPSICAVSRKVSFLRNLPRKILTRRKRWISFWMPAAATARR